MKNPGSKGTNPSFLLLKFINMDHAMFPKTRYGLANMLVRLFQRFVWNALQVRFGYWLYRVKQKWTTEQT